MNTADLILTLSRPLCKIGKMNTIFMLNMLIELCLCVGPPVPFFGRRILQCWCDIHVRYAICDKNCDMILVFQKNIAKIGAFLKNIFETEQSGEF